jgi:uncharacterized protein YegP (UPF0339 family)
MLSTIEVYKDKRGEWRVRERASNGKITTSREAYASKSNAKRAARAQAGGRSEVRVVIIG